MLSLSEAVKQEKLFMSEHLAAIKRQVIVFDLDHTLIDSSHRYVTKEDGSFDLDGWIKKSTWEYIQDDSLLPLCHHFFAFKKAGFTIIAVTARQMSEADYRFLEEHDLIFDAILERGDSVELDEKLKDGKLHNFLQEEGRIPFLFYDDKDENLLVAEKYGFKGMKAQLFNLKTVVKDYHSIRNINDKNIVSFAPKEEDLAQSNIKILTTQSS